MSSSMSRASRAVVFHVAFERLPDELRALLSKYRRMVNQSIRAGLERGATSRGSLARLVYKGLAHEYRGVSAYIQLAISDAVAILRAHRKRQRRGRGGRTPYVRRFFLKAAPSSFHVDANRRTLRVSVGNGRWVMLALPVSAWHRAQLDGAGAKAVLLTIKPGRIALAVSHPVPPPFDPRAVLALDTNEETLDGVFVEGEKADAVSIRLGDVRLVQARHFVRRRRLAAKKAHDRRLKRALLEREGKRERDRVRSRLHVLSTGLVRAAKDRRAAIALEDLTGIRLSFSRRLNRRLSAWPHRELHRQIAYKAQAAGVPVILVDPFLTSQKCAACGWTPRRFKTRTSARRPGRMFVCGNPECGWRADRQLNAGVNILRTALGNDPGLGGVRFRLDALSRDVMNPLLAPAPRAERGERMEREFHLSAPAVAMSSPSPATGL